MNNVCILPFSEIHILSNDNINFCCYGNDTYQTKCDTILDIFYNDDYVNMIRAMLDMGMIPQYCSKCMSLDDSYNSYYKNRKMNNNKRLELSKITYSPSNLCNLHCRTCNMSNSSSYNRVINGLSEITYSKLYDKICMDLDMMKNSINKYTFMGGEPLLEKRNSDILDILKTSDNENMAISFITNGTTDLNNFDILDKLKHFKNVEFSVSVDGTPELMNYMRGGYDYTSNSKYLENILATICYIDGFVPALSITISNLNTIFMYEFVEYLVELKKKYNFQITVNYVHTPSIYSIENVTDEIIHKWNNVIVPKINNIPNIQEHQYIYDKIINPVTDIYKDRIFNKELWDEFILDTKRVDGLEGVDLYNHYINKIKE